jgi:hypothetical protein
LWSSSFSIYENIHKDQSLKKDLMATATRFGLLYILFDVGIQALYTEIHYFAWGLQCKNCVRVKASRKIMPFSHYGHPPQCRADASQLPKGKNSKDNSNLIPNKLDWPAYCYTSVSIEAD